MSDHAEPTGRTIPRFSYSGTKDGSDTDDSTECDSHHGQDDNNSNYASSYAWQKAPSFPHLQRRSLTRRPTSTTATDSPIDYSSLICGFVAGVSQAAVFNPYDRALYLSIKDRREFLHFENWKSPYNGFFQSIGGRALQGGLYFPFEHFFLQCIPRLETTSSSSSSSKYTTNSNNSHPQMSYFLAGTAAGGLNAIVLNPLSAIKYKTWGREVNRGMWKEATGMLRKSGFSIRPFFNGLQPTLCRDVVFGGTYTWLRLQVPNWIDLEGDSSAMVFVDGKQQPMKNQYQWISNLLAAGLATVVSGPFNYVRNIQYGTPSTERAPSTLQILSSLVVEVQEQQGMLPKMKLIQVRLRIGWGTARVALGMTFAHSVYDSLYENVKPMIC